MAQAKVENAKLVRPGKEIVAAVAEDFKGKLRQLVENGITELTLDLEEVEIIDAMGLGMVLATHNSLKKVGGNLKVINLSGEIFTLFKTMRLDQHFEVKGLETC
jgi:anti-sigma B factor antagonist